MSPRIWSVSLALCLSFAAAGCSPGSTEGGQGADIEGTVSVDTQVIAAQNATATEESWGVFREYFAGETAGVSELLSGTATIEPGMEIHPPHKHAEEEFLMVLEGQGEWTVGEEVFAANKGDMLYASAWDLHGIKNTGDAPLTFVFWKWNSKGLPVPPKSDSD